jgi:gas vesicle protein
VKFFLGLGIGVALGILFAPARGEETRRQLSERAHDLASVPGRQMQEKVAEIARKSEQKAGEVGSEVGRQAAEAAVRAVREEVLGDPEKTA